MLGNGRYEGAGKRAGLRIAAFGEHEVRAGAGGEAVLLSGWCDGGCGLGERGAGDAGKRGVSTQITQQQAEIGAEVEVEDTRPEALLTDETGTGVL